MLRRRQVTWGDCWITNGGQKCNTSHWRSEEVTATQHNQLTSLPEHDEQSEPEKWTCHLVPPARRAWRPCSGDIAAIAYIGGIVLFLFLGRSGFKFTSLWVVYPGGCALGPGSAQEATQRARSEIFTELSQTGYHLTGAYGTSGPVPVGSAAAGAVSVAWFWGRLEIRAYLGRRARSEIFTVTELSQTGCHLKGAYGTPWPPVICRRCGVSRMIFETTRNHPSRLMIRQHWGYGARAPTC